MNEWIELGQNKDGTHNICCGVCGVGKFKSKGHARSYYTRHKFKYCPNCGAKMADRKTEPQTNADNAFQNVESVGCDRYVITNDEGERAYNCIGCERTDCAWK